MSQLLEKDEFTAELSIAGDQTRSETMTIFASSGTSDLSLVVQASNLPRKYVTYSIDLELPEADDAHVSAIEISEEERNELREIARDVEHGNFKPFWDVFYDKEGDAELDDDEDDEDF